MTYDTQKLTGLRDRVRAATGPDRELDCETAVLLDGFIRQPGKYEEDEFDYCYMDGGDLITPGYGGDQMVHYYTASVDAALALVERVLPRSDLQFIRDHGEWDVQIGDAPPSVGLPLPLAILDALLTALIERDGAS